MDLHGVGIEAQSGTVLGDRSLEVTLLLQRETEAGMSAHVVGIETRGVAEFSDRPLKIALLQQRSSEVVMVAHVAQKIASRSGLGPVNASFQKGYPGNQRMAKHLVDKAGCLKACQKRSKELSAIRRIQLKITGGCWRGSKTTNFEQPSRRFEFLFAARVGSDKTPVFPQVSNTPLTLS